MLLANPTKERYFISLPSIDFPRDIKVWQMPDGKPIATLTGHNYDIKGISFSPDGKILVSYSRDRTIRLWQMPDGKPLSTLSVHTDEINEVIFSPDGKNTR